MSHRRAQILLLLAYAYALTMTWQIWIGFRNVYSANPAKAAILHQAILENRTPPGVSWGDLGANGSNIRRLPVLLADELHRVSGLSLPSTYLAVDTVLVFATLVLLAIYLRRWMPASGVALGLLYYGSVGSMTYLFHYFHPWDRMSQVVWLVALIFLRDGRFWPLLATMAVGMTVKYDLLPLPALYAALTWRRKPLPRWLAESAALGLVAIGVLGGLIALYPGGFSSTEEQTWSARAVVLLSGTLSQMRSTFFAFPPLLMFGLPLALAFSGWRRLERFHRFALVFGCLMFVPLALASHLREVRAHMPILFLVLPPAVLELRRWLAADEDAAPQQLAVGAQAGMPGEQPGDPPVDSL